MADLCAAGLMASGATEEEIQTRSKVVLAELIVCETLHEMGEQMCKFGDDQSNNPTWYKSMEAVEKYFGVEE